MLLVWKESVAGLERKCCWSEGEVWERRMLWIWREKRLECCTWVRCYRDGKESVSSVQESVGAGVRLNIAGVEGRWRSFFGGGGGGEEDKVL